MKVSGDPMPALGPLLSSQQLQRPEVWIEQGAGR